MCMTLTSVSGSGALSRVLLLSILSTRLTSDEDSGNRVFLILIPITEMNRYWQIKETRIGNKSSSALVKYAFSSRSSQVAVANSLVP
jgi:hypothetical protein